MAKADAERQELDCENVPDCMDGEQTWPTEEELAAASAVNQPAVRKVAKVDNNRISIRVIFLILIIIGH